MRHGNVPALTFSILPFLYYEKKNEKTATMMPRIKESIFVTNMLLSPTNTHLTNKDDEFTTASDNASACEVRSVWIRSRPIAVAQNRRLVLLAPNPGRPEDPHV